MGRTCDGEVRTMILLDANYVLRFLLRDNEEMYQIVRGLISQEVCHIDNEVLVEVVFVLIKVYDVSRHTIRTSLGKTVALTNIRVEDEAVILRALEIFDERNLDIVDAILCAKSTVHDVRTFDKKLNKCIRIFQENVEIG